MWNEIEFPKENDSDLTFPGTQIRSAAFDLRVFSPADVTQKVTECEKETYKTVLDHNRRCIPHHSGGDPLFAEPEEGRGLFQAGKLGILRYRGRKAGRFVSDLPDGGHERRNQYGAG
ncbi:MAG: hypothetical protein J5789_09960 [Oscillospiraceae bacterium]|nr:hypothetical protein [Oscillospiraceae bacterium]